jgi:hypothetical protein
MRKLISVTMMGVLLTGLGIGISGCSEEAKEKGQPTTTTPGGPTKTPAQNPTTPPKTP